MKTYLRLILRKIVSAYCERWDLAFENMARRPLQRFSVLCEKVAFGTIVQLILENKSSKTIEGVFEFCISVGLPVTLAGVGVDDMDKKIRIIARHSVNTMHAEPFILVL